MQLINTCTYVVEAILSLWMDFPAFNRPPSVRDSTVQHPHMRAFRTPGGETKEGCTRVCVEGIKITDLLSTRTSSASAQEVETLHMHAMESRVTPQAPLIL